MRRRSARCCWSLLAAAPAAAQMPGGAPQEPPGALHRYYNSSTNTHWVTPTPGGGRLRVRAVARLPAHHGRRRAVGDVRLPLAAAPTTSSPTTPGCEGTTALGVYGWIGRRARRRPLGGRCTAACSRASATSPRSTRAARATPARAASATSRARQPALARYFDGGEHWVTAGTVSAGFRLEFVLGFLLPDAGPRPAGAVRVRERRRPLPLARPGLRGPRRARAVRLPVRDPPPGGDVCRCTAAASSPTTSPPPTRGCEGQVTEALLGYAAAHPGADPALLQPVHQHALGVDRADPAGLVLRVHARLPAHARRATTARRSTAAWPAARTSSCRSTPAARASARLGRTAGSTRRPGRRRALPLQAPGHRPFRLRRRRPARATRPRPGSASCARLLARAAAARRCRRG